MSSGRHQGNRKRSHGTTSLARTDGQPSSSEANANPTRSKRTTPRGIIEDDVTPAERAILELPLVRGTSDVPSPLTGRGQGSRSISRRDTSSSRSYKRPGSSSVRAEKKTCISLETAAKEPGTSNARVTEDDSTPAERDISGTQLLRNLGKHPSVYAGAGQNPTTTQASGRHLRNRKRSRGTTSLDRADGQLPLSKADANITRSKRTTSRRVIEEDITPAERAISNLPHVRGTSNVPLPPIGRGQGSRSISRRNTGSSRSSERPGSSNSDVSLLPTRRGQGRRNISHRNTSLSRTYENVPLPPTGRGQGSTSISRRKTSSSRTCTRPGSSTSDVPLPPTGRGQGSRSISRRNTRSSRTYERPDSSLVRGDEEPKDSEDDLTPAERDISGTPLLRNLGKHPSVYARAGQNPSAKGLSFRGAWNNAVELYRAANAQYKEIFVASGLGDFFKIDPVELPQGYLIALTERWFAETNTLHLPCCEIGPTPVDWTMITGIPFGGQRIKLNTEYGKEKVRELLGVRSKKLFKGNRICLSVIKPKVDEVSAVPPTREAKERIFRRLFLYVIGSCFFGNNQSVIHHELVEFLEDIDAVEKYDWGAITYAAFLAGMRRKVTGLIGSFTAFWQFLLFWAFEYLSISRPEHAEVDAFPRATRWKFPKNLGTLDNSELTATRCQLDYVDDESKVTWQPYLASQEYISGGAIATSIDLAKKREPFISLESWEYYLGERCQRQLGLPCLVPLDPPNKMEGASSEYPDRKSMVSSAQNLVHDASLDYASWFADNSIGKIVDVNRLIGGTDIGRKVVGHWMAKHRPGMIIVPKYEVEQLRKARDTADAKRQKLQKELSRLRRGSDS